MAASSYHSGTLTWIAVLLGGASLVACTAMIHHLFRMHGGRLSRLARDPVANLGVADLLRAALVVVSGAAGLRAAPLPEAACAAIGNLGLAGWVVLLWNTVTSQWLRNQILM